MRGLIIDVRLTVAVDVPGRAEELDGRFDDAGDVEHEQDERTDHDDAGKQSTLIYKHELEPDEEDGE